MTNEEVKLEPCPFCGGEAELMNISGYFKQGLSSVGWFVKCRKGCVEQNPYSSDHDAIEAWNNGVKEANKEPKLERCPFCGSEAETKSFIDVIPIIDENGAYVDADTSYFEWTGCPICEIGFTIAEEEPDGITIDKWNRRVKDE